MALFSAKQLLDELMGRDRDLGLEEKKNEFTWDGPDICKNFLVKFCPHDLFVNTKADLGMCPKIHDERLKKEYESSSRCKTMGYEEDFLRFCQNMLSDVDKRIRRANQRLALSIKESSILKSQQPQVKTNDEQVSVLTERINGLIAQVENLGCEGKVEEAQGIMKLCDQLKEERDALQKAGENNHWMQTAEIAAAQEKQMEVCNVCGAFLIVGDAQQRVDDHLMGKQHVGYARLKEAADELVAAREKERSDREKQREQERDERRRLLDEERKKDDRKRHSDDWRRDADRYRDKGHRSHRSHHSRSPSRNSSSKSKESSKDKDRSRRRGGSSERKRERSRSKGNEHRHKRSRSRSSGRHSGRERKDNREKKDRRKSSENGEKERDPRPKESKERHTSGD